MFRGGCLDSSWQLARTIEAVATDYRANCHECWAGEAGLIGMRRNRGESPWGADVAPKPPPIRPNAEGAASLAGNRSFSIWASPDAEAALSIHYALKRLSQRVGS